MNPKKIIRKLLPKTGIRAAEEVYRKGRVYGLQARYGFPARGMRVVAVTGTNGKTTTCCYINEVLKAGGYRTAMFTTAVVELAGVASVNKTHRTVPLTKQLVTFIKEARAANVDFLVLETTSQALDQHKMLGIDVDVAVMTNLTQDHLDYHSTMERYKEAKARLFNGYMKPRVCVLNRDDMEFPYFAAQSAGEVLTYGQHPDSDLLVSDVHMSATGSLWMVQHGLVLGLKTHLPGLFNVHNATAAVSVGKAVGLSLGQIQTGISSLYAVPGRMELIDEGQPFTVVVDYAHTPDALKNVLTAAKEIAKKRVIVVSGSAGDRDKSKRPEMGKIMGKLADLTFLTDDETYTENPEAIRADIRRGLDMAKGTYKEIADRTDAIKAAFAAAKKGDVVVLAGIGHQDYRNMGGKHLAWDEREVARSLLRK